MPGLLNAVFPALVWPRPATEDVLRTVQGSASGAAVRQENRIVNALVEHHPSAMRTRILAALVIADGRWVSTTQLKVICQAPDLRITIARLRQQHGAAIETRMGHVGGYRLTALPPDCCLDAVLDAIHALRRDTDLQVWRLAAA